MKISIFALMAGLVFNTSAFAANLYASPCEKPIVQKLTQARCQIHALVSTGAYPVQNTASYLYMTTVQATCGGKGRIFLYKTTYEGTKKVCDAIEAATSWTLSN